MSDIKQAFGTSNQTITITLASLTNTSSRASTVIDNSSNLFNDALVYVIVKTGAGTPATTPYLNIYAYATANGGTNYTEGATGTDAGITLVSPTNLKLIGIINTPSASTSYSSGPFSVASVFGGVLPQKWGVIIQNNQGQTLDSTSGNHSVFYQGVYATVI